ncbi:MAG: GIY-YIG nuclease family protein [Candidatus Nanoarchaeia archaeon]|nr:GIY-YIG nuclease family protein [Candidatus Nanoarchaeia archaeon]
MKGAYCIIIEVKKNSFVKIGALGKINFKKGLYCYVGSALNNLEKRIQRHLIKNKKFHWHVDYLLMNKNTSIKKVFYKESNKREECRIAEFVSKNSIGQIENFGCSDCKCKSHLFLINNFNFLNEELNPYKRSGT